MTPTNKAPIQFVQARAHLAPTVFRAILLDDTTDDLVVEEACHELSELSDEEVEAVIASLREGGMS